MNVELTNEELTLVEQALRFTATRVYAVTDPDDHSVKAQERRRLAMTSEDLAARFGGAMEKPR